MKLLRSAVKHAHMLLRRLSSPAIFIQKSTERHQARRGMSENNNLFYVQTPERKKRRIASRAKAIERLRKNARSAHEKSVNLRVEIIFNYSHFSRIRYEVFVGNDVVVIGAVIVVSKLTRAHDCSKNTFSTYFEMTEPRARSGSRIQTILPKVYFIGCFFVHSSAFFW